MANDTVYHLEPTVTERGPIKVIGVEDLFVQHAEYGQIGMDGETKTPDLYRRLREVPNPIDPYVRLGIQRVGPKSRGIISHDCFYHMAAYEVDACADIPSGFIAKVVPPSRYAVYSCEAPRDSEGRPVGAAQWEELFEKVIFDDGVWNKESYLTKGWYIEVTHYSREKELGNPVVRFELMIAIE